MQIIELGLASEETKKQPDGTNFEVSLGGRACGGRTNDPAIPNTVSCD